LLAVIIKTAHYSSRKKVEHYAGLVIIDQEFNAIANHYQYYLHLLLHHSAPIVNLNALAFINT